MPRPAKLGRGRRQPLYAPAIGGGSLLLAALSMLRVPADNGARQ